MRLFIAIQLSEILKDELTAVQDGMRAAGVRGNFTKRENLHLTLAFIGEFADPSYVLEVIDGIDFSSFRIRSEGIGSFGDLWWSGISESAELNSLVRRLRRGLSDAGIPFDKKKFRPHITLIRKAQPAGIGIPGGCAELIGNAEMTVDHISLMRSDRTKSGMVYTEITS